MRKSLMPFGIVFVLLFVPLVLATHPKRLVDWLFYAGAAILIVAGVAALAGRGGRIGWGWGKPGETWDGTGRVVEPLEDFEKPRNEGDLL